MSDLSKHRAEADITCGDADLGRRGFVAAAATTAAVGVFAGWAPAFELSASELGGGLPGFPADIRLYKQAYRNWSDEIRVDGAWTCAPRDEAQVLRAVNWAHQNGYKVRAQGQSHNWSPLTFHSRQSADGVLLVNMAHHLTGVSIDASSRPARVNAHTGIRMDALMARMEAAGLGFTAVPAIGEVTLGGVLAIDGHGTAVPARGETLLSGHTYGSVSNLVLSLTAVVWDASEARYVLKTFDRADPECGAFLTHLGRAMITRVTLQAGANQRLRCRSYTDIDTRELFASAGSGGRTFASFLDEAGRIETICFPFTRTPWTKVWSVAPRKPLFARPVFAPYNYPFSDSIPKPVSDLISQINRGIVSVTPLLGAAQLAAVKAGLLSTLSSDLWGWSKNTLNYIRASTLRVTANGYAILTNRANVQGVLHDFVSHYDQMIDAYRGRGQYPMNGPVEIRVTGLDRVSECLRPGAQAPHLSALRARPDRIDWDVAVWLDILTLPGTPAANQFYREMEDWIFSRFDGGDALARVEWSKGWAYGSEEAWSDERMIHSVIPDSISVGQPAWSNWNSTRLTLNKYDPGRLFTSRLLEELLPG